MNYELEFSTTIPELEELLLEDHELELQRLDELDEKNSCENN